MPSVWNRVTAVEYPDCSVQRSIVTGADGSADPLIAGRTGHNTFVRRILVVVTTSAAQSFTFRTNNGTPVVLYAIAASAALGVYEAEYAQEGNEGYMIATGEDLDLAMGGAGPGAIVIVEAHRRLASNTPISADSYKTA